MKEKQVRNRLTKKPLQIMEFMIEFRKTHDFFPSYEEIKEHFNYNSVSYISRAIDWLEVNGYMKRDDRRVHYIILKNVK